MTFVYILSDYGEHGAQNVVATLDRSNLVELLKRNWPEPVKWDGTERPGHGADDISGLEELLEASDEDLRAADGANLTEGWGGIQLHVVLLDEVA